VSVSTENSPAAEAPVKVSDRAASKIAGLINETAGATAFRVTVEGGGCSGFQYKFDLVETTDADDLVVRKSGAVVVVDPISLPYMLGSEIDLTDNLMGEALEVHNPLAVASCGCGTSFSI
jgi:iron-sulfur cluster assembly accessory protein